MTDEEKNRSLYDSTFCDHNIASPGKTEMSEDRASGAW